MAIYANDLGINAIISKASDESNKQHLKYQLEIHKKSYSRDIPFQIEYLTYKKDSTMIEESQQLAFAELLVSEGFSVVVKERDSVMAQLSDEFKSKIKIIREN